MAIPRAVEKAAQQADEIYSQMYSSEQPQAEPEQPEQPAQPVQSDTAEETPEVPAEETPAQEAPQQEEAKPVEQKVDPEKWEAKYKTLAGKYSSEVPKLAADNRDLRGQIEALKSEMEELRTRAATPAAPLISDEDKERYGEDMVDFVQRAVKAQTADKEAEINSLKKQLESFTSQTNKNSEVTFFERLGEIVPDWVSINDDEAFHRWLDEREAFSGQRRQDLLATAEAERDAPRVAAFFNAWKSQTQKVDTARSSALSSQVAPESKKTSIVPEGKRLFSRQEIADFYAKARRGEIKAQDQMRIEGEIHQALVEGRVR